MQRRLRRTSIAWFTIAAVMFFIAVALTVTITWVRPLEPVAASEQQFIGVLIPRSERDAVDSSHVFYSEARGMARITLAMPADGVVYLVSLADENACRPMIAEVRPPLKPGEVMVRHVDWIDRMPDLYAVVPSHNAAGAVCETPAKSRPVSFMSRELSIEFASEQYVTVPAWIQSGEPSRRAFLASLQDTDLVPVPSLMLDLSDIAGADGMRFNGGFEKSDEFFGGAWRRITAGEWTQATWTNIYRQQFRDILLIVIGTLIGIGVTVMIEGLRPIIEELEADSSNPFVAREHRRKKD